ncbi:hypothetical protein WA158_008529 [Blastocystis sp. Blastoise]
MNTTDILSFDVDDKVWFYCQLYIFIIVHIVFYIGYRLLSRLFKWKRMSRKRAFLFEDIVQLSIISGFYFSFGNFFTTLGPSILMSFVEFYIPCTFSLFICGALCEMDSLNIPLKQIKSWTWLSYLIYTILILGFLYLIISSLFVQTDFIIYAISLFPILFYYGVGSLLYFTSKSHEIHMHFSWTTFFFLINLIYKTDSFYTRFSGGIFCGIFIKFFITDGWSSFLYYEPESTLNTINSIPHAPLEEEDDDDEDDLKDIETNSVYQYTDSEQNSISIQE